MCPASDTRERDPERNASKSFDDPECTGENGCHGEVSLRSTTHVMTVPVLVRPWSHLRHHSQSPLVHDKCRMPWITPMNRQRTRSRTRRGRCHRERGGPGRCGGT